ncbi:MAG TPA: metallophosphoesterase family protein, partial [Vicinamibacteria bacterium]|nr:metallophosphoesterase family protein [Vicinamibacteria bacterium]
MKPFRPAMLCAAATVILVAAGSASAEPWKFGVMSDTQWTISDDPAAKNPHAVAKSIIDQINAQFIRAGVRFVIQVGDLTENGYDADIAERAAAAQPLIDAGIGFFPMRGNHETYAAPDGSNGYGIPEFQKSFPQTQTGEFVKSNGRVIRRGRNFSSPTDVSEDLAGMSYSFDYGRHGEAARFVILDDWVTPTRKVDAAGYFYGYSIADQQAWISGRLNRWTRHTEHAFVFSHQNLIGENHQDSLFNGYTNANPDMQNAFFASLQTNGVRYYVSGHDHIHQRSIIASPDGKSKVEEIIGASNSSKFYTPKDLTQANWFGQKVRETSLSQERY